MRDDIPHAKSRWQLHNLNLTASASTSPAHCFNTPIFALPTPPPCSIHPATHHAHFPLDHHPAVAVQNSATTWGRRVKSLRVAHQAIFTPADATQAFSPTASPQLSRCGLELLKPSGPETLRISQRFRTVSLPFTLTTSSRSTQLKPPLWRPFRWSCRQIL